jgi:hypothetical protein
MNEFEKRYGRKRSWLIEALSQYFPGGNEEDHGTFSEDSQYPGPKIEPGTFRIQDKTIAA